jgi:hypothetical protein
MKRIELLNAIDEIKDADDVAHAIDTLKDLAVNFCDNYETEFNYIRDALEGLAPHIDKVNEAHRVAEKCGSDLY